MPRKTDVEMLNVREMNPKRANDLLNVFLLGYYLAIALRIDRRDTSIPLSPAESFAEKALEPIDDYRGNQFLEMLEWYAEQDTICYQTLTEGDMVAAFDMLLTAGCAQGDSSFIKVLESALGRQLFPPFILDKTSEEINRKIGRPETPRRVIRRREDIDVDG